jgi:hypothetical protein
LIARSMLIPARSQHQNKAWAATGLWLSNRRPSDQAL